MNISMWILVDWLKQYDFEYNIKCGKCVLSNIRALTQDTRKALPSSSILLCHANKYDPAFDQGILCLNGDDSILIHMDSIECIYNEIMNAFDYYTSWENNLSQAITNNGKFADVINAAKSIFQNPLILADSGGRILFHTLDEPHFEWERDLYRQLVENDFLKIDMQKIINEQVVAGTEHCSVPFFRQLKELHFPILYKNINTNREHIGWLMLWETKIPITKGKIQLLNFLGEFLAANQQTDQWQDTLSSKSMIFKKILNADNLSTDSVALYMNAIGWQKSDPKILCKLSPCQTESVNIRYVCNIICTFLPSSYSFIFEQSVLVICNLKNVSSTDLFAQLQTYLRAFNMCIGLSCIFYDITHLRGSYEQTKIALKYGHQTSKTLNYCEDYLEPYVYELLRTSISCDISHEALNQLHTYDTRHGTDYYHTLQVYLQEERNQTKTAQTLNIHRNTFLRRLSKIQELINIDLDNSSMRFHLWLSYILNSR